MMTVIMFKMMSIMIIMMMVVMTMKIKLAIIQPIFKLGAPDFAW